MGPCLSCRRNAPLTTNHSLNKEKTLWFLSYLILLGLTKELRWFFLWDSKNGIRDIMDLEGKTEEQKTELSCTWHPSFALMIVRGEEDIVLSGWEFEYVLQLVIRNPGYACS